MSDSVSGFIGTQSGVRDRPAQGARGGFQPTIGHVMLACAGVSGLGWFAIAKLIKAIIGL